MPRGISNKHILVNQSISIPYYGCKWRCKNLICENGPHEHLCVQSPKVQLRCPLVKAWVTSDVLEAQEPVLMHRGVSNKHILVNQSVINPYYGCN